MAYALVTGASKGIGKAIALELAAKGFDLLLVARNEQLLQQTAEEIKNRYAKDAHFFVADLSQNQSAQNVYDWCCEKSSDITVLVNNAGYGLSGKFETYTLQQHLDMLRVNVESVVKLTYLFIPQLKEKQQAYILNIASNAAYQAVPYLGLYAATKAFILQFSRALHYELNKSSVSVTCVSPGTTDTDFAQTANVGPKAMKAAKKLNMTSESVAKIAVDSMLKGKTEVVVGLLNKVGAFFVWLLPKKLVEKTAASLYE